MNIKKKLVLGLLLLTAQLVLAQDVKYWIFLTDKETQQYDYRNFLSAKTIENRQNHNLPLVQYTDIPLTPGYVNTLQTKGIGIIHQSRWLNAVSAFLTPEQVAELKTLPFVKHIQPMNRNFKIMRTPSPEEKSYATAISQMQPEALEDAKLTGDGVYVGVIDAGYIGARDNEYLRHLFNENRILGVRDMLNPAKKDHYKDRETGSDDHGNTVLQMITGYANAGTHYGFATKSKFFLARTDHGDNEFRGEEDHWVAAMEWMDSVGVQLINTSLGYALSFDDPKENYKPEQMDGKTSVISRAAQVAVDEKGLLIVVSAGNEGTDENWEIVSTPADAQGVLSIGATNMKGLKMNYSSIGPEFLPYLKPNVSCFSLFGTSFSAPVITGFAACLIQNNPKASNKELRNIIEQSGSLYPYGNNYVGYGIPRAGKALQLMEGAKPENESAKEVRAKDRYTLKLKENEERVVVFHKKNERTVIDQDTADPGKGDKYEIKRKDGAERTTVVYGGKVLEIIWK